MKLLHTADWHVGKTVRGRSRAVEHEAVLDELAEVADAEAVDAVLVVGDLFDTAAPTPEAERIVYRALLRLSAGGARPVVVVSGNHDNPRRLGAVSPVFDLASVHVATAFRGPDAGGVLELEVGPAGEPELLRVALVPFLSQRYVVSAADLMGLSGATANQQYGERVARLVEALCAGFTPDAVNVVAAHLMVAGGLLGGGERQGHTIFDYVVPALAFPAGASYVALGHLHRTQLIGGAAPIWYPGSPLQLDFGEAADDKAALVIEAAPGVPATVRPAPLTRGRRFRTLTGTLDELALAAPALLGEAGDLAATSGPPFVKVVVREPARVGLDDEVRDLFDDRVDVVEVRVDAPGASNLGALAGADGDSTVVRSPHELFEAYLAAQGVADERLVALFDELVETAAIGSSEADDAA